MVKVFGHRGMRQDKERDENSLEAYAAAFETSDGVELDVVCSNEGTLFLTHDISQKPLKSLSPRSTYVLHEHLDAASAKKANRRRIDQMKDSEVHALRLKKGARIPVLSEVFALMAAYPDKTVNIELKGENTADAVLKAVDEAEKSGIKIRNRIILTSFNHDAISRVREIDSAVKCGVIFSRLGGGRIFPWSKETKSEYVKFGEKALRDARLAKIKPEYFILNAAVATPKALGLIRQYFPQTKVMVWTTREPQPEKNRRVMRLLSDPQAVAAVEAVITDHPREMSQYLKKKKLGQG